MPGVALDPVRDVEQRVRVRGEPPPLLEPQRRADVAPRRNAAPAAPSGPVTHEQVAGPGAAAAGNALATGRPR